MRRRTRARGRVTVALAAVIVGIVGIVGIAGIAGFDPSATAATSKANRTTTKAARGVRVIRIEMGPISYSPKVVKVRAGEKVRFTFHNGANVDHDALIGDIAAQTAHEKMMKATGTAGDAHHLAGPAYVFVAAGTTASLDHTFTRVGRSIIGCHQPGHWASGMRIDVVVDPRTALG